MRFGVDNKYNSQMSVDDVEQYCVMDGDDLIKSYHLSEALGYRTGFRAFCENV